MPEFLLRELRKPTARLPTDGFYRFLARVCEAPEQKRHLLLAPALRNMPFLRVPLDSRDPRTGAGFPRTSSSVRSCLAPGRIAQNVFSESRRIVTGPSFTNSTYIIA